MTSNNNVPNSILKKSEARMAAVKALYAAHIHKIDGDDMPDPWALTLDIISSYDESHAEHHFAVMPDKKFLTKLVAGVCENIEEIDYLIERNLGKNWTKDRIDNVMLSLLRVAIFELSALQKIPFKVIINEYINIAKAFFGSKETSFINGILDKIAHDVRS